MPSGFSRHSRACTLETLREGLKREERGVLTEAVPVRKSLRVFDRISKVHRCPTLKLDE